MGRHHGTGFNNGIALNLRLLFQGALNPDSRQAKGRIDGLLARQRARGGAGVNRQPAARIGITAANFDTFHQNAVARGRQIHIVANVNNRRQEAHILGEFFTDTANTPQQFAILLEVHHRDQAIAHFHPQRIFQLHVVPGGLHGLGIFRHFHRRGLCRRFHFTSAHPPGQAQQARGEQQEDQVWHPRHHAEQA